MKTRRIIVVFLLFVGVLLLVAAIPAAAEEETPFHPPQCETKEFLGMFVVQCKDVGKDIIGATVTGDPVIYNAKWDGESALIRVRLPHSLGEDRPIRPVYFCWCVMDKQGSEVCAKHGP